MDLNNLKFNIDAEDIAKKTGAFLEKKSRWILAFVFLAAVAYCAYLLYRNIYNPNWSDAQKAEYINSKGKGVEFDEKKFNSLLENEQTRQSEHREDNEDIPDIFLLK